MVAVTINTICGRENEPAKGDGLWAPGTLVTSAVGTTLEGIEAWAKTCEEETGGGKTIILNGISGSPNFSAFAKGIEDGSELEVVMDCPTNYTPEEALTKTSAALLANPDLAVIMSTYPPVTEGAIQALKSAGKQPGKDVKLCNWTGGNENMTNLLKSGELAVDSYANYAWATKNAFEAIIDATEGKSNPRVILPSSTGEIEETGNTPWPPASTNAEVAQYEPTGE